MHKLKFHAAPNNGMQRTRSQQVFHTQSLVRAADAGRSALAYYYL
jgi:hypothetical protein